MTSKLTRLLSLPVAAALAAAAPALASDVIGGEEATRHDPAMVAPPHAIDGAAVRESLAEARRAMARAEPPHRAAADEEIDYARFPGGN